MLLTIVKDALEILGYNTEQVFNNNIGIKRRGDDGDKQQ
jgi:hypothetical protein